MGYAPGLVLGVIVVSVFTKVHFSSLLVRWDLLGLDSYMEWTCINAKEYTRFHGVFLIKDGMHGMKIHGTSSINKLMTNHSSMNRVAYLSMTW